MSLTDQARIDTQKILTNNKEFGVSLIFATDDSPPTIVTVYGTTTKHNLSIDREGAAYNGKITSVTVFEKSLTDLNYPVRNTKNEVDLKNHKITLTDSTGIATTYKVDQWFPDQKIGLIVIMLGDYKR